MSSAENFSYSCPHCNQHFDCVPECEGVACICPTCNNVIYPKRPTNIVTQKIVYSASNNRCTSPIDWDDIEDEMQMDMEDAIDEFIEYYPDNMNSDLFETAAERAWNNYKTSFSFEDDFEAWCEDNCYDDDDYDFALDEMKSEWIDDWKFQNEGIWQQDWCTNNRTALIQKWHDEYKEGWLQDWAQTHALYYNTTAAVLLKHWGVPSTNNSFQVRSITLRSL